MRISCITNTSEIGADGADLIVLPEYTAPDVLRDTVSTCPRAIVVGAIQDGRRSRGQLWHRGRNRIRYVKVDSDGRTDGGGDMWQSPVYELSDVCIGVVICMDINLQPFWSPIVERIMSSSAGLKLLCIPADMGSQWFSGDTLMDSRFDGVHVVLCNNTTGHQARCKSFITDLHRTKIRQQIGCEPIHWDAVER